MNNPFLVKFLLSLIVVSISVLNNRGTQEREINNTNPTLQNGIYTNEFNLKLPNDKSNLSQNQPVTITVYSAGSYSGNGVTKAAYWKGTERSDLEVPAEAAESRASAITVENGIVYTAGYYLIIENNRKYYYKACYWTGTERTDLKSGSEFSIASSITVADGIIYTAGNYGTGSPCYWKGSEIFSLDVPDEHFFNISTTSIAVDNDAVYVAGYYIYSWYPGYFSERDIQSYGDGYGPTNTIACYWKNGSRTDLTDPYEDTFHAKANDITTANGEVFIAGVYSNQFRNSGNLACYWKGSERIDLGPGNGKTITVENDIPYVADGGMNFDNINNSRGASSYWQDQVRLGLDNSGNEVYWTTDIKVINGQVYISGYHSGNPGQIDLNYWRNSNITAIGIFSEKRVGIGSSYIEIVFNGDINYSRIIE